MHLAETAAEVKRAKGGGAYRDRPPAGSALKKFRVPDREQTRFKHRSFAAAVRAAEDGDVRGPSERIEERQLQRVDPRQHDAAVAVTSHLPQILSTALAAYIGERRAAGGGRELLDFAGSGLETFLRLAGSDASVWRPLIESNRANIQSHIDGVLRVVRDILDGDSKAFARAQQLLRDLTNR